MRKNIFKLLLAASVLSGCTDSDVDLKTVGGADALKTDRTLLEMNPEEATFSIQVFAADNTQWQAVYSSDTDWLHIDNEGQTYSGNGSITGSVSENTDPAERSAMVEIRTFGTFGSSIATVGVTVIQYGTQPFVRIMDLNNNQLDEYKAGSSQSSFTVRVVSNTRWLIESDAEWIRILTPEGLSGEGSANVTLEVSENTSYEEPRFGYVTVKLADIPETSARVKISQEQKSDRQSIIINGMTGYLPEGPATLLLDNEGETLEVAAEVTDNGNRTVITLQDPVDAGTYLMQEATCGEQAIALGGYVTIGEALESGPERWDVVLKQFGGETRERPVVIDSGDDLQAIAEAVNGGTSYAGIHLSQSCDLSLAAFENWVPIGSLDSPFKGIYHGNGHAITDLTIQSSGSNVGLFGCMAGEEESPAVVEGINLQGKVVCTGSGAGCIVGRAMNHSEIRDCVNNATWDFSGGCSGGIVGICTSDNSMAINLNRLDNILVENCRTTSSGRFSQKNDNAGIVGFNYGTVRNCTFEGSITSQVMRMGGVVGANYGIVERCVSSGTLAIENLSTAHNSGGIIGFASQYSILRNCLFDGDMSGVTDYRSGGLIGMLSNQNSGQASVEIRNCLVVGVIGPNTGIILGNNNGYTLDNMLANGKMTGIYYSETMSSNKNCGALATTVGDIPGMSECLTKQELGEQGSYVNWDFTEVWEMNDEKGYPTLKMN